MAEVTPRTRARSTSEWQRRLWPFNGRTDDPKNAPLAQPEWEYQNQRLTMLYEALTARVGHRDALLWQSPALAMTAQAFLLTIALGHESRPVARFIAAFLGLWVTYMSIQLMLKHRMYMWNDQVTMVSLERLIDMPTSAIDYDDQIDHLEKYALQHGLKDPKKKKLLTTFVSVHVWIWGLSFFGLINLLLLIFAGADAFGAPCWPAIPLPAGESRCLVPL